MYKVSLLPYEYKLVAKEAQKKDRLLLLTALAMVLLAIVYFVLTMNALEKGKILTDVRLQSEALDRQIAEYDALEQLNRDVHAMLDKVQEAYGNNPEWVELISLIGNSVPNGIGLTSLDMKLNDGKGECTVHGLTTDLKVLSQWLETLRTMPGVRDIRHRISTKTDEEINDSMRFELHMTLLEGAGYRITLEEDAHEAE